MVVKKDLAQLRTCMLLSIAFGTLFDIGIPASSQREPNTAFDDWLSYFFDVDPPVCKHQVLARRIASISTRKEIPDSRQLAHSTLHCSSPHRLVPVTSVRTIM